MKAELYKSLSRDNPKHARVFRFIDEYPIDLNGTQAAIRAGYSAKTAHEQAAQLLANLSIRKLVDAKLAEIAERNAVNQDYVLQRWKRVADYDVRQLCEYRRICCRRCWGVNFAYQETFGEHETRLADYEYERDCAIEKGRSLPRWNDKIEIGYDISKDANPDCLECRGDGELRAFIKDMRGLSDEVVASLDLKIGKDGIELKSIPKEKALEALGRYVGLYNNDQSSRPQISVDNDTMDELFISRMREARERQAEVALERGIVIDMDNYHGN